MKEVKVSITDKPIGISTNERFIADVSSSLAMLLEYYQNHGWEVEFVSQTHEYGKFNFSIKLATATSHKEPSKDDDYDPYAPGPFEEGGDYGWLSNI